jgi:hypothetical protein
MRKPKEIKKEKVVLSFEDNTSVYAENCKVIYESFLKKGFTTEQSFQLLLKLIDKTNCSF